MNQKQIPGKLLLSNYIKITIFQTIAKDPINSVSNYIIINQNLGKLATMPEALHHKFNYNNSGDNYLQLKFVLYIIKNK